ncbi:arginase, hepatic [Diorhabda sublineata]|uniref:arginase, hepatic n=1 Tax=Diorhabda sublineata TaxID=1163346 RepID=UPI0024E12AAF|nr:arginase, hepatic [Diorhabda sublineata]
MFKKITTEFNYVKRQFSSVKSKIGIIGVPFGKGASKTGANNGPEAIRTGGLFEQLSGFYDKSLIHDYGNIAYKVLERHKSIPNMKEYNEMVSCNEEVSRKVEELLRDDHICLTLGGDHSIAVGTVDGHVKAKKDICILWIDAHADLNTNKTSDSGNIHGMPLAILASELSDYWPYLPGMDWQKPVISLRNLAYIGLRSVDPYERMVIDKLGITAFGMADVEEHGIHSVVEMALRAIDPDKTRSIHVSFDIDSLDTLEAPSTGTSVRGGLTLREGIHLMEMVYDTGRLSAMDLVEVNPDLGSEQDVKKTVDAAIQLISAAFGNNRRGMKLKNATLPLQTFPPTRPPIM